MDRRSSDLENDVMGEGFSFADAFRRSGLAAGWMDVLYGFEKGYVDAGDVSRFAVEQIERGEDGQSVLDLAWPGIDEWEAKAALRALAGNGCDPSASERRWRFVLTHELQDTDMSQDERPLKRDLLYRILGSPMELNFIRSVVTHGDSFWDEPHSPEECRTHHAQRIEEYLQAEAAVLAEDAIAMPSDGGFDR